MVMRVSEAALEEHEIVATSVAVAREIFVVAQDVFSMARVGSAVVSSWLQMSLGWLASAFVAALVVFDG